MSTINKNDYIKYLRSANFLVLKYFKLLVVLIFFITLLSGYFFLLRPRFEKITDNLAATELVKNSQIESYQVYLNKLKRFNKSFTSFTEEEKSQLNTIIPDGNDYGKVIELIDHIVKESSGKPAPNIAVTFKEVEKNVNKDSKVLLIGKEKELAVAPSQIKVIESNIVLNKLSYDEFKKFLSKLENSLRIIDVTNVSYTASGDAKFTINFYYYDE